jgi:glycosyltransferase involved in cell wall biosynthesis
VKLCYEPNLVYFYIKYVIFYGHIKNELKFELLRKAHLVLMSFAREDRGLVVTEANAMGTRIVAYNVPGLRDSVIDKKTGILTKVNLPKNLADATILLLSGSTLLRRYSTYAPAFLSQFSWDNTADAFERLIRDIA